MAAFRATLEEVVEADLLLHVADASHSYVQAQVEAVEKVLSSPGALDKPTIMVYNKADRLNQDSNPEIIPGKEPVLISALTGDNISVLLEKVCRLLSGERIIRKYPVPFGKPAVLSIIHENGTILRREYGQDGVEMEVELPEIWAKRIDAKL